MGSLHIRSLGRIILLAGLLSMCWPTAVNAQVSETSVEGQNITAAANFIRSMGMEEVADQIIQALKDGEIYQDDLSGGDMGKTSPATTNITIDNSVLGTGGAGKTLFTSKFHFGQIFHLAMVLYHENVHKHQNLSKRIMSIIGKEPDEYEAWTRTLAAATEWVNTLWKEYTKEDKAGRAAAASKLEKATTFLASEADSFVTERKAFKYDQAPWKKFQKLAEELGGLAIDLSRAEAQGKEVTQEQRTKISELVRDTLMAEKAVIGDLPKPKKQVRGPPRRIEAPRKEVRHATGHRRARVSSALPGGHCYGSVSGADPVKRDPDAQVTLAMVRECVGGNQNGAR